VSEPAPDPSVRPVPAIGPVEWRGPRRTAALLAVVMTMALALLGVRASGVLHEESPLPPLPEVAAVAPGILRGAEPTDADLQRLRDKYDLRAVVAVGGSSVEAQAAAQALGIALHDVAVDPITEVPPPDAVAALVQFLHRTVPNRGRDGGLVYVYDVTGTGPVIVTTLMLALLDGQPLASALDPLAPDVRTALTPAARTALAQVAAAPTDPAAAGPYAALSGVRL
jgi:hypothetical protein